MCVKQVTGLTGTNKHWLLRAGTLELFMITFYLITRKEIQSTHTAEKPRDCVFNVIIMMLSCEHTASVAVQDGWKQLTSQDGEEGEEKVVLSACPAELRDCKFGSAAFHGLLDFRSMQSALRSGRG